MTDTDAAPTRLTEEQLEILRLVENQTISADEATRLLEALDRSDTAHSQPSWNRPPPPDPNTNATVRLPGKPRSRNVRIRITYISSKEARLNLVLPLGLLDSGLKMAKRIAPDRLLEAKDIRDSVDEGFIGTILDILDEDEDERVEILIEARE